MLVRLAVLSVLGAALVAPAVAQDNFPEVPRPFPDAPMYYPSMPNPHWAAEALYHLKAAGLLVGYPDGLFRGSLSESWKTPAGNMDHFPDVSLVRRDERWAATMIGSLKFADLSATPLSQSPTRMELASAIYAAYTRLSSRVGELGTRVAASKTRPDGSAQTLRFKRNEARYRKAWAEDISKLKKLTALYEKELALQGIDVEAMKKGLDRLRARVSAADTIGRVPRSKPRK